MGRIKDPDADGPLFLLMDQKNPWKYGRNCINRGVRRADVPAAKGFPAYSGQI
jgi:hypothetical protein